MLNTFTFSKQYAIYHLDFDNDGLATTDIESIEYLKSQAQYISALGKRKNNNNPEAYDVNGAQETKIDFGIFHDSCK